jgi:hypothetical protein
VGAARQPVPSLNVSQRRLSSTEGRSLRRSCASPSLPSLASWAGEDNRSRRELTRVEAQALERHLPRTTPLPTLLLLKTWRSTWEKLTGRPSASVKNASVDEVVREPRVAPISSRQPLLQSMDVLPEPHVVTGKFSSPVTTTDLTFLYLVSRGELKWTTNGLPPTKPGLHAGTNLLYKPRGAVHLGGTPDGPLNVLCPDNSRRRQRTPSPVDCRFRPDDAKLLGFVATALVLIKERVLHQ